MTVPNDGIFEDGYAAAFAGAPETEHDYSAPHLIFQRFSWLSGYAKGLGDYQTWQLEQNPTPKERDQ